MDDMNTNPFPFPRTSCACERCVECCYDQPGPLAPGDFERIAEFLGETREEAKRHFWASPGALIKDAVTGRVTRVGSITPQRRKGKCVFLDENDRCTIHPVAPTGCAYFDTHMSGFEGHLRSLTLVKLYRASEDYQKLRNELPYAQSYKPRGFGR